MATPDFYIQPGASDVPYPKIASPPRVLPSPKETQASLKRSFEKYLAVGKLFRPIDHLAFEQPKHIHTMEDLGYAADSGVSPVAVSDPFSLFSEEAIDIMRSEVLDPEVVAKYSYSSDIAARQIRGYAPKHGKFVFEAWKHPETLAIISRTQTNLVRPPPTGPGTLQCHQGVEEAVARSEWRPYRRRSHQAATWT